ncbi:hypothetical protein GPA22_19695 [Aromatoleum toluvorans]|uniref:Bacteriophage CI repressor N-terminal domain-containing protein n=1 Tax=Aromatoleum toluvorans TaxID=92002 RepID=A0ABX1Q4X8_9RHOO|nr:helix-turn-helix domain-containing protein [Aromatoleum toluvorans]NMG45945.1 hypothetical protein [Aromatoleum toluvorans]
MEDKDYVERVLLRLKEAADAATDADLAKMLGMSPQAFNNRKKAQSLPNSEIIDLCNKRMIDLNFVFRGEKGAGTTCGAGNETLYAAMTELQAWQVREQRFLPPEKFVETVLVLAELAEGEPAKVKPAAAKVLRLVA